MEDAEEGEETLMVSGVLAETAGAADGAGALCASGEVRVAEEGVDALVVVVAVASGAGRAPAVSGAPAVRAGRQGTGYSAHNTFTSAGSLTRQHSSGQRKANAPTSTHMSTHSPVHTACPAHGVARRAASPS